MAVAPSATTPLPSQRWPRVIPIARVVDGQRASRRPAWSGPARPSSGQVGPVQSGDRVEVEVDGIGVLAKPVVAEPPPAGARDVAAGLDRPGHRPGHGSEP
jgi:hypothetical protein